MSDLRRTAISLFAMGSLVLATGAFAPLWTDTRAADPTAEGTPIVQGVWAAIHCLTAALLIPRWKTVCQMLAANPLVVLLIGACGLSALWSENPTLTLRKTIALAGTTLFGLLLATYFNSSEQVNIVCAVLGATALASLLACLVCSDRFPPTELAGSAWNGVFSHKNLLGRAMSLGSLGFLCLRRQTTPWFAMAWIGAALCFAMLLASHSQTALVVFLAMLCTREISKLLRWEWRAGAGVALLLLVFCVGAGWAVLLNSDGLLASLHRDVTFTGRARIWSFAATSFLRQPWLGYGYGAFWWVASESRQTLALIGYPTPHAHNGFLDLGLQIGTFGIVIFLGGWGVAVTRAIRTFRASDHPANRWPLMYLLFLVFYSLTENSLLSPNSLLWALYIAVCGTVSIQATRPKTATLTTEPASL